MRDHKMCNIVSFYFFCLCVCETEEEVNSLSATECFSKSHIRLDRQAKCFPSQAAP